ncbi:MAG: hypothetical protein BHW00_04425 [Clostridium sp. 26_22]|nr:MAG: hypothetical protein BHW00_04425 [Clostridium sp. 26_22]
MNNDQLINLFTILLFIMIGILAILCIIFIVLKLKSNQHQNKNKNKSKVNSGIDKNSKKEITTIYNKQSIFKFMEFDKIEDNMITQKDGKRFLMVIECQGINYDLMSGLEKNSVEQGFLQFLNTLRYPIQIYVQTRTVNLSSSIDKYKERVDAVSKDLVNKQMQYNQKVRSGLYEQEELDKEKYEIVRQKNLYEYGVDIINNTERMSLNRNILTKQYYVIIPCYPEEVNNTDFDKEEVANIAFSELYTKAQTIISSLSVCGINGKILNSVELAELLYVAYNRDESEVLDLQKVLNSGYEDLYSTAPNVFDKRMKELDLKIEEDAIKKANDVVLETMEISEKEKKAKRKEQLLDDLIQQMAVSLIKENEPVIGKDIADKARERLENEKTKEEGGKEDEKKTRTRRKSTKSI